MYKEFFNMYNRCFPEFKMREGVFYDWLKPEKAHIIRNSEGGNEKLTGFALIHGNSIALLCVDKKYRRRGFGSRLLKESEEYIKQKGADRIILGHGVHYVFQGVPLSGDVENKEKNEDSAAVDFFKKRGYEAEWVSVNMEMRLADFDISALAIPPKPDSVSFRFADYSYNSDRTALLAAVEDADSGWVGIFEDCADPVMLAVINDEIVGFQILAPIGARFSPQGEKAACIGCVGVIKKARKLGIGRQMVAEGINWLKGQGCTSIELRYVELFDWYRKLGFYIMGKQWMGEKIL
ncbi:MAG: GNAT family N-acetyltransferase [Oscillospiraceae bacterium]|nr:GNAT family N-acetyltransferase [Oscillospiraceae bacterium]